MKSFINKRHNSKPGAANQSVPNAVRNKQSIFHANNRTEATVQRKFQQIANDSSLINQFKFENNSSLLQRQAPEEEALMQGKFNTLQRQELEEEELLQGKFEPVQRVGEEEELIQGKFEPVQRFEEEEELLQGKFATTQCMEEEEMLQGKFDTLQKQENNTGLADNLKSGMEQLSGQSLDHVKVHYNSPKPAAVQAHAFAQGSDIYLASGQEKHLPHELGHVVQQMEGRVKPTTSVGGMSVNDNAGLENEATVMGEKALQRAVKGPDPLNAVQMREMAVNNVAGLKREADVVAARAAQFKLYNQNLSENSDSLTESAIQLRQAFQGGKDVNPVFETGKAAFDRMIAFIKLGATSFTVGIGSMKVCDEAGALWEQSEAPEGMVRQYLAPVFKDKQRGWQANFWEKPAIGGKETINLHLSMYK